VDRPPLALVLALHNHQPHGNFGHVLQRATTRAYAPLLAALTEQPHMRLALHYSGTLLEWLTDERPEVVEQLAALVRRGQVELLTGGYHEPILPVVPPADRLGQIRALTGRISDQFGVTPTGLWLTERVWEPSLAYDLAAAGIHYTIVDDSHFLPPTSPRTEVGPSPCSPVARSCAIACPGIPCRS
jgi:alpha-amylase